jgi:hypothetical protein
VANKNISESDNSSTRGRTRAAAKPRSSENRPQLLRHHDNRAADNRVPSVDARIDTGADMSVAANANQGTPRYEEIAEAAYLRFLSRGCQDGADFDDWVEAERDLRERRSR